VTDKRGIAFIAPSAFDVPTGRMVDPETSLFWVSWQENEPDDPVDDEIRGAEAAIAWGRERADVVFIRLGHDGDTYFSAGVVHPGPDEYDDAPLPEWPPQKPRRGLVHA
jgi:hypothetical protein